MDYLISVIDDGQALAADSSSSATDDEMAAIDAFNDRLRADGHWVYANGLADPATATVIDNRGDAAIVTDGPFAETKEVIAGYSIWEVKSMEEAVAWVQRFPMCEGSEIELRPIFCYTPEEVSEIVAQPE